MDCVLIIHEVEGYSQWKRGLDNATALRKDAEALEYQVLQYASESNRVVHFSKGESHAKAKLFFESKDVQRIRDEIGVKRPEFIYLTETESGVL
jgi:hypothetical protein